MRLAALTSALSSWITEPKRTKPSRYEDRGTYPKSNKRAGDIEPDQWIRLGSDRMRCLEKKTDDKP